MDQSNSLSERVDPGYLVYDLRLNKFYINLK